MVIFDFDGTLVDTAYDVAQSLNEALERKGFSKNEVKDIMPLLGGKLEDIIKGLIPEENKTVENIKDIAGEYKRVYRESKKEHSVPFKGVLGLLDKLKENNIKMAINSNKPQEFLEEMVDDFFFKDTFDYVIWYKEWLPPKPSPVGTQSIIECCGVLPNETIYIGDGEIDHTTAGTAGVEFMYIRPLQTEFSHWKDSIVVKCQYQISIWKEWLW